MDRARADGRIRIVDSAGTEIALDDLTAAAMADVFRITRRGGRPVVVDESEELTTTQAASILGVSREWAARMIDRGELPGHRVGKHRRVALRDVLAVRDRRSVSAPIDRPTLPGVRKCRSAIEEAARRRGFTNVRVFGSVARGEATTDSDIDLLVDAPRPTGLFALAGLEQELTDLLGRRVDVLPSSAAESTPHLRDVFRDAVPL